MRVVKSCDESNKDSLLVIADAIKTMIANGCPPPYQLTITRDMAIDILAEIAERKNNE